MQINLDELMAAIEEDDFIGFCLACGEAQGSCEPDGRELKCSSCGAFKVYDAEEVLLMGEYVE